MPVNLNPPDPKSLLPVAGVRLGITQAGVRKAGRKDLLLISIDEGACVAGVFTQNRFCAAPVVVSRQHLSMIDPGKGVRALVINTGVANAGTGAEGLARARQTCADAAQLLGCNASQVLPFSTGVIMEPLPVDRIVAGLPQCIAALKADAWADAAAAIMTTDTVPKAVSRQFSIGGATVTVTGISKGAGMIHPGMATMLGFVATDAKSPEYLAFRDAVTTVATTLAQAIVRDGEGATKFITIKVEAGRDEDECRKVAFAIAHSPLIKTAFFASDPNLGRILAAIGYAGINDLEVEGVELYLDDVLVAERGGRSPSYDEAQGQRVMKQAEITVRVVLNRGRAATTVWTCDLSHDYVSINADYRS